MRKIFVIVLSVVLVIGCSSAAFAADNDKYMLYVNCTQNIVTVYENDGNGKYNPMKAFVCSVGEDTPNGTFKTSDKYTWRLLFGNVYGQYATRITGHILFHSVPYYTKNKNDLEYEEYNKLGETASMGCIRLSVDDSKWIYDNCSKGTTVKIYRSELPELVDKPLSIKIDMNDTERRGWDPTDPDSNNPWNKENDDEEDIQKTVDENITETVNVYINGKEISLEAYKSDDGQYYFAENDVIYALSADGNNVSLNKSGSIMYIKNKPSLYIQKSNKKEFISAEKGSIAAVYKSMSKQLNTYMIDGNMYLNIIEVASLMGYPQTNDNLLWISTK